VWKWACGWWMRPFKDFRIILEQDGDLSYFYITARFQRIAFRILSVCVLVTIGLGIASTVLWISKERLKRSHQEVFQALADVAPSRFNVDVAELSEDDMIALAESIRQRDAAMRDYLDTSVNLVSKENQQLLKHLQSSGLTEDNLGLIRRKTYSGGAPMVPEQVSNNPLMQNQVVTELAKNRELRDILKALPTELPLKDFGVTSDFGMRVHPITGRPDFHPGLDLIVHNDSKIKAVKDGKVIFAGDNGEYGNTVIVRHESGMDTLYAHMSKINVKVGDDVKARDPLGLVGNTGLSSGPHLHFEILIGGRRVNPMKVILAAQNVQ
jgi:murein DD-endopeptidase MepM/ murein hydrolase activator NlpD